METNELRLEALDLNQQGATLLRVGNAVAAREKFDAAIEIDPMVMESYKNYGDLYMHLEEYQNAKNSYKKALLIEKSGELHFLYGNACFMNDEPHEGFEHYNIAINEGFDGDDMMFFMGMAYEHMNDDEMALRYFQKACVKNPSRPDYMVKKIGVLARLGQYENANTAVDELLMKAPELYDGYHIKTQFLLHEKKYDEAVKFSKAATERFPEDADLFYDYARALSFANNLDEAVKVIESAKKMKYYEDSKRRFVLLEGQLFAENNNYEKAVECCLDCISMEAESGFDSEVRFMLMNLYLANKENEKALEQASALIKHGEEDLYYYAALYYRAFCTKQIGDTEGANKLYKEANSCYRIATLKNPAAVDVYLYRAMCLKDMEEYGKAMELIEFILGLNDQIAEVYIIRADIYRIQGRNSLCEEDLKKAYSIKPELKPETNAVGE